MVDEIFDERWLGASIPSDHWHFHRQLLARYGIVMAPGEFTGMLNDITKGRALRLVERPKGRAIFSVRLKTAGERIYVLAVKRRVITAWPPNARLNQKRRDLIAALAAEPQPELG
ncbi:hypothetical protein [Methylobacterium sp. 10]|uniref:hypothetical protein n=1 Tax=Methylobacterium sp. 10 TaxID=1101191 RepID=UPI0004862942|nr:hypothetical protein [Methylobacterium sp. 10]